MMTMRRTLTALVASGSILAVAACSHDAAPTSPTSSSVITKPVTVGHISITPQGTTKLRSLGTNGAMFGRGTSTKAFTRIAVTGVTSYRDVTPEQYVKATAGNEISRKSLLNAKVISSRRMSVPGAREAYVMTLTGKGPQHETLRQTILAMRGPSSNETALVTASATTSQLGVLSRAIASVSYVRANSTLGAHTTISTHAAAKSSLERSLKAAPK